MVFHLASIPRGVSDGIAIIEYRFYRETTLTDGSTDFEHVYSKFALTIDGAWFDTSLYDTIEAARAARSQYRQRSMTAQQAERLKWLPRAEFLDANGSPAAEITRIVRALPDGSAADYIARAAKLSSTTNTRDLPPPSLLG